MASPKPEIKPDQTRMKKDKIEQECLEKKSIKKLLSHLPPQLNKPPLSKSDLQVLLSSASSSTESSPVSNEDMDLDKLEELKQKLCTELEESKEKEDSLKVSKPQQPKMVERVIKEKSHIFDDLLSSLDELIMDIKDTKMIEKNTTASIKKEVKSKEEKQSQNNKVKSGKPEEKQKNITKLDKSKTCETKLKVASNNKESDNKVMSKENKMSKTKRDTKHKDVPKIKKETNVKTVKSNDDFAPKTNKTNRTFSMGNRSPIDPFAENMIPSDPFACARIPVGPISSCRTPVDPLNVGNRTPINPWSMGNPTAVNNFAENMKPGGARTPVVPFLDCRTPVGPMNMGNKTLIKPWSTENRTPVNTFAGNMNLEGVRTPVGPFLDCRTPVGPMNMGNKPPINPWITENLTPVNTFAGNMTLGGARTPVVPFSGYRTPVGPMNMGYRHSIDPFSMGNIPNNQFVGNMAPIVQFPGPRTPVVPFFGCRTPNEVPFSTKCDVDFSRPPPINNFNPNEQFKLNPNMGNRNPMNSFAGNMTSNNQFVGNMAPMVQFASPRTPVVPFFDCRTPVNPLNMRNQTPMNPFPENITPSGPYAVPRTPVVPFYDCRTPVKLSFSTKCDVDMSRNNQFVGNMAPIVQFAGPRTPVVPFFGCRTPVDMSKPPPPFINNFNPNEQFRLNPPNQNNFIPPLEQFQQNPVQFIPNQQRHEEDQFRNNQERFCPGPEQVRQQCIPNWDARQNQFIPNTDQFRHEDDCRPIEEQFNPRIPNATSQRPELTQNTAQNWDFRPNQNHFIPNTDQLRHEDDFRPNEVQNKERRKKIENLCSPLDNLYSSQSKSKVGKGYGLQNFRIPKKRKPMIMEEKKEYSKEDEIRIIKDNKTEDEDPKEKGEIGPEDVKEKNVEANTSMESDEQPKAETDKNLMVNEFIQNLDKSRNSNRKSKMKKIRPIIYSDSESEKEEIREDTEKLELYVAKHSPAKKVQELKIPETEKDKVKTRITETVGERHKNSKRKLLIDASEEKKSNKKNIPKAKEKINVVMESGEESSTGKKEKKEVSTKTKKSREKQAPRRYAARLLSIDSVINLKTNVDNVTTEATLESTGLETTECENKPQAKLKKIGSQTLTIELERTTAQTESLAGVKTVESEKKKPAADIQTETKTVELSTPIETTNSEEKPENKRIRSRTAQTEYVADVKTVETEKNKPGRTKKTETETIGRNSSVETTDSEEKPKNKTPKPEKVLEISSNITLIDLTHEPELSLSCKSDFHNLKSTKEMEQEDKLEENEDIIEEQEKKSEAELEPAKEKESNIAACLEPDHIFLREEIARNVGLVTELSISLSDLHNLKSPTKEVDQEENLEEKKEEREPDMADVLGSDHIPLREEISRDISLITFNFDPEPSLSSSVLLEQEDKLKEKEDTVEDQKEPEPIENRNEEVFPVEVSPQDFRLEISFTSESSLSSSAFLEQEQEDKLKENEDTVEDQEKTPNTEIEPKSAKEIEPNMLDPEPSLSSSAFPEQEDKIKEKKDTEPLEVEPIDCDKPIENRNEEEFPVDISPKDFRLEISSVSLEETDSEVQRNQSKDDAIMIASTCSLSEIELQKTKSLQISSEITEVPNSDHDEVVFVSEEKQKCEPKNTNTEVPKVNNIKQVEHKSRKKESVINVGAFEVRIKNNQQIYICKMHECKFKSPSKIIFKKHCSQHKQKMFCKICVPEKNFSCFTMTSLFVHLFEAHKSGTKIVSSEKIKLRRITRAMSKQLELDAMTQISDPIIEIDSDQEPTEPKMGVLQIQDVRTFSEEDILQSNVAITTSRNPQNKMAPVTISGCRNAVNSFKMGNRVLCLNKNKKVFTEMTSFPKILDLYKCSVETCSYSTNLQKEFRMHMMKHPRRQVIVCVYCQEGVSSHNLISHIVANHAHCTWQCAFCFYRSVSKMYLLDHQKHVHKNNNEVLQNGFYYKLKAKTNVRQLPVRDDVVLPYRCTQDNCDHNFLLADDFMVHLQVIHKKYFKCSLCDAVYFVTALELLQHYAIHEIARHQCQYCRHGTHSMDSMRTHYARRHSHLGPVCYVRQSKNKKDLPESASDLVTMNMELKQPVDITFIQTKIASTSDQSLHLSSPTISTTIPDDQNVSQPKNSISDVVASLPADGSSVNINKDLDNEVIILGDNRPTLPTEANVKTQPRRSSGYYNFNCRNKNEVTNHISTQHGIQFHKCAKCKFRCSSEGDISLHFKKLHPDSTNPEFETYFYKVRDEEVNLEKETSELSLSSTEHELEVTTSTKPTPKGIEKLQKIKSNLGEETSKIDSTSKVNTISKLENFSDVKRIKTLRKHQEDYCRLKCNYCDYKAFTVQGIKNHHKIKHKLEAFCYTVTTQLKEKPLEKNRDENGENFNPIVVEDENEHVLSLEDLESRQKFEEISSTIVPTQLEENNCLKRKKDEHYNSLNSTKIVHDESEHVLSSEDLRSRQKFEELSSTIVPTQLEKNNCLKRKKDEHYNSLNSTKIVQDESEHVLSSEDLRSRQKFEELSSTIVPTQLEKNNCLKRKKDEHYDSLNSTKIVQDESEHVLSLEDLESRHKFEELSSTIVPTQLENNNSIKRIKSENDDSLYPTKKQKTDELDMVIYYSCVLCPIKSVDLVTIREHFFRFHAINGSFMYKKVKVHNIKTMHDKCKVCNTYPKDKYHYIQKHDEQICEQNTILKCQICFFICTKLKLMKKHVTEKHPGKYLNFFTLLEDGMILDSTEFFVEENCNHCGQQFENIDQLYNHHILFHSHLEFENIRNLKKYKCSLCSFVCFLPSQLKTHHITIHPGEKPLEAILYFNPCTYTIKNKLKRPNSDVNELPNKILVIDDDEPNSPVKRNVAKKSTTLPAVRKTVVKKRTANRSQSIEY